MSDRALRYRTDHFITGAKSLPACDRCPARAGHPCVSRSGQISRPHKGREGVSVLMSLEDISTIIDALGVYASDYNEAPVDRIEHIRGVMRAARRTAKS